MEGPDRPRPQHRESSPRCKSVFLPMQRKPSKWECTRFPLFPTRHPQCLHSVPIISREMPAVLALGSHYSPRDTWGACARFPLSPQDAHGASGRSVSGNRDPHTNHESHAGCLDRSTRMTRPCAAWGQDGLTLYTRNPVGLTAHTSWVHKANAHGPFAKPTKT